MKLKLTMVAAGAALAACITIASATTYTDTTGDLHNGLPAGDNFTGFTHLDITSVEVTNNLTDLIFKINLAGDPVAVNWGKYCIGFDATAGTGDTSANGNGWGRAISMTQGMDYWVGSWVDGAGGAELRAFDGLAWSGGLGGASVSKTTSNVTINVNFALLGKDYGDTIDFNVYTTGGGGPDPAIDASADPNVTVTSWGSAYSSGLAHTYTIAALTPTTNLVTFLCDMEVPIWEYDTATAEGFYTNSDALYVRGSFNGWGAVSAGYQLIQVGPTLFSNTVEVVALLGDTVQYKFEGISFPGYENPISTAGANRTLTFTNLNMPPQFAFFEDRALSNGTKSVTLRVDMSVAKQFGVFDPSTNGVLLPGSFNGWNTGANAVQLDPEPDPNPNIYSTTLTFDYYPVVPTYGFFKFFISNLTNPDRDNGWENPISQNGGNRSFGIATTNQTLSFLYNDENPIITITGIEKLDADSVQVTFSTFPGRGAITTGGVYVVESRDALTGGAWSTNGTVYSTTTSSSFTNTGVSTTSERFYRAGLIGL